MKIVIGLLILISILSAGQIRVTRETWETYWMVWSVGAGACIALGISFIMIGVVERR